MNEIYVHGRLIPTSSFLIEKGIKATGFDVVARSNNVYIISNGDIALELVWETCRMGAIEFSLTSMNQLHASEGLLFILARQIITSESDGIIWDEVDVYDVKQNELIDVNIIQKAIYNGYAVVA